MVKVPRVVSNPLKALLQVICCELVMESNVDVKELRFTIGLHFCGGRGTDPKKKNIVHKEGQSITADVKSEFNMRI